MLSATKNEDKLKSIKAGVKILENFLEEFDRDNRGQQNKTYLSIDVMTAFDASEDKQALEFIETYRGAAKGRYEYLRTLYPKKDDSKSWDIVRNKQIAKRESDVQANKSKLFNDDGSPTSEHLKLIHWAYSPSADKLKAYLAKGDGESKKRKSKDDSGASPTKKQKSSK